MPDISLAELSQNIATDTGNALQDIANEAANFYCDLYAADPLGVTGGLIRSPVGTAVNALNSSLCNPRNRVPPPAQSPFNGGQCPIFYNVNIRYKPAAFLAETTTTIFNLRGAIQGKYIKDVAAPGGSREYGVRGTNADGTPDDRAVYGVDSVSSPGEYLIIDSVVPTSGVDNCGNPPPGFPPTVAPVNKYNTTKNINLGGGITGVVPFTFIPVRIEAGVEIKPEINVKVGDITVKFSAGGVTFDFGKNGDQPVITPNPNTDPRNPPPPAIPPSGSGGGSADCPDVNLQPVLDKFPPIMTLLNDIKKCSCPPNKRPEQSFFPPRGSNYISIPVDSQRVVLIVTSKGSQVRGEYGGGDAPDVEYVGWYAWGYPGGLGDRKPISYLSNSWAVPIGATDFSYTLKYNSLGSVIVHYLVPAPPP